MQRRCTKVCLEEQFVQTGLRPYRVATGYGQPPSTFYDWTLAPFGVFEPGFILPKDAQNRLLIERFNNKVTEALYRNRSDPVGLASDEERSTLTKFLAQDYDEVERSLQIPDSCTYHLQRGSFFQIHPQTISAPTLEYSRFSNSFTVLRCQLCTVLFVLIST